MKTRIILYFLLTLPFLTYSQHLETEPNDTKAQANTISFTTPGQNITGVAKNADLDYFQCKFPATTLGLYENTLVVTTAGIAGHILSIRGLAQVGGVITTTEIQVQTSSSTTSPSRMLKWYSFGKAEQFYMRVIGNASTTSNYVITWTRTPITPVADIQILAKPSDNVTFSSLGQTIDDTDFWMYNSSFNPIAGCGNDDEAGGASFQSIFTRTYVNGEYYLALSRSDLANNQAAAPDDFEQNGNTTDFGGFLCSNETDGTSDLSLNYAVNGGATTPITGVSGLSGNYVVAFVKARISPIAVGNISDLCPGTPLSIPFNTSEIFNTGNVFTAQLSDASGNFAAPVTIGSLALDGTDPSGSIPATIPIGTSASPNYKIRVVSSSPAHTGVSNPFTVFSSPTASVLSGSGAICTGGTQDLKVSITGGTSLYSVSYSDGSSSFVQNNYSNGANIPVSPAVTTTYNLISVTDANGCVGTGNSGTPTVIVNVSPSDATISGAGLICAGGNGTINVAVNGGASPYTVTYSDGVGNFTANSYVSGANITVSPLINTTYTLVSVVDNKGCSTPILTGFGIVNVRPPFNIQNSSSANMVANGSCDVGTWTHYYDNGTNTILLSIEKNGNNIGTIGDGTFMVRAATTSNFGTSSGTLITAPYVTNTAGWYVMNRCWDVRATTQPLTDVNVRTYFTDKDLTDINGSVAPDISKDALKFYKINGLSSPDPALGHTGVNKATSYNTAGYWQYDNALTASNTTWRLDSLSVNKYFAEYGVASFSGGGGGYGLGGTGAFPLEWVDFTVRAKDEVVELLWTVEQEKDNAFFTIMHSIDNQLWESIENVPSIGNHSDAFTYTFTHNKPVLGQNYYKIAQTDYDGRQSFSEIRLVNVGGTGTISISPNPSDGNVTLEMQARSRSGTLTVRDALDRIVYQEPFSEFIGKKEIQLQNLPNGIYYFSFLEKNGKVSTTKIQILN